MKPGSALWCALSLMLGSMTCPGIESTAAAPAPSIVADDQFFVDHPDLTDEAQVVEEASNALAAEGYEAGTVQEASESLAAKCHAILAERTPGEWQQKAVSLYPALGIAGSEFNLLFVKHYRELKASSPAFAEEPSWPVLLAKRCDDELRAEAPAVSRTIPAPPPLAASPARNPDRADSVHRPRRSADFWQTSFALLLLIVLTALPGALAFRQGALAFRERSSGRSRQPARPQRTPAPGNDPQVWRAALKHAAIIYVVAALPASVHSLMDNSDLGFIDRLFVSLLVGSLFGIFITLPLYGIDTLWHACQKHPGRPATR